MLRHAWHSRNQLLCHGYVNISDKGQGAYSKLCFNYERQSYSRSPEWLIMLYHLGSNGWSKLSRISFIFIRIWLWKDGKLYWINLKLYLDEFRWFCNNIGDVGSDVSGNAICHYLEKKNSAPWPHISHIYYTNNEIRITIKHLSCIII